VITEERAMSMFVEANPVSSRDDVALIPDGGAAYLTTLEQRSSEVTQLDTKQTDPTSSKRSMMPWLIAAALAAVVGVAIIVSNQNSGEVPVVDEPTPTTVVDAAPTTAAGPAVDPVEIGESYINAIDEWDSDAALALLAPGAVMASLAESPTEIAAVFDFYRASDWRWTVSECQQTNVGEPAEVRCIYTNQNAWARALDVEPGGGAYEFVITDGEIGEVRQIHADSPEWGIFTLWVMNNHNADFLVLVPDGCCRPSVTPEAIVLWGQYTEEFVAEQDGS